MNKQTLVILGGGFAGVEAARSLEKQLSADWEILLISKDNYLTYNPLLPEAVGASILPSHVVAPLRQMVKRTQVRMLTVTAIDLEKRLIHYRGEKLGVLHYHQLVLACGVGANLAIIPGMETHGLPLKTVGDALHLRNRVMSRLEHADIESDAGHRRWLTRFIVVGGGFSGVEVAAEIDDYLDEAARYYPAIELGECRVTLLQSTDRILPELSPSLSDFALSRMRKTDIDVRLNASVVRVDEQGVWLNSGEHILGATVVCTIGTAAHPLLESLPLAKQRGRITTDADMSVPGYPGVWAIGDCAAVVNAADGRLSPPTAQFAVRQARQLANNIVSQSQGKPLQPFRYRAAGALSAIGHNKAVGEIYGVRVRGFIAFLMWRGVYLLKLPTLARKVRIFLEWNWEMLFPADIAHLNYTRSSFGPVASATPAELNRELNRGNATELERLESI